ncbi:hypothetical protein GCM10011506_13490 [Marivirga lumbricoides]|uniref:DUF4249 domain-containing protein n=1 Tax=Marivirga lumbricoides TaxID=1046115 RepID=A0ABQ1LWR2_9BACT|nr:hypothetical protein GCM10011506_13490 [Marivirga lumbricoides]
MKFSGGILLSFIVILLSLNLSGCESCKDCNPENAYPYFNLKILNRTSLDSLRVDSSGFVSEIKLLDSLLADRNNAAIADSLTSRKTEATDSLTFVKNVITTVKSGLISIESINNERDLFTNRLGGDSLTFFRIPIDGTSTESEYYIQVEHADFINYLKISYTLSDTVINNKITKAAKGLKVIDYEFKSIRGPYGCTPVLECSSNELEIYVEI